MTYDLRPPALDELGLVGALGEQAASFAGEPGRPLDVVVDARANLPPLPAAVEVAAYRIAVEAMTNVARHSGARTASVRLPAEGGDLVVEVVDDGRGVDPGAHAGVGHRSMRERADELGGTFEVTSVPGGGTRVRARLPLRNASRG